MNGMDSRDQDVTAVSEPVRHQVHHSYIWLGTLRVVLALRVVAAVSMLSSIIGAISEGMHGGGAEVGFVIVVTAGISLAAFCHLRRDRLSRSLACLQAAVLRPRS